MSPPGEAARHYLKRRTAAAHEAMEAEFGALSVATSPGAYGRFLSAHLNLAQSLEGAGAATLERIVPNWTLRQKAPLLIDDLRALGFHPPAVPTMRSIDVPSAPALLGRAYVSEGAMLGNRVILPALGPECRRATAYLTAYGDRLSSLWREFIDVIEQQLRSDGDRQSAADAANAAFAEFGSVMRADAHTGRAVPA